MGCRAVVQADLPGPGIKPKSLGSPALAGGFFTTSATYKPKLVTVQLSSVAQSCLTPGVPVHHHLPEFAQTHVHRVSGIIQPSHPLSSPSSAFDLSQHQGLFQ